MNRKKIPPRMTAAEAVAEIPDGAAIALAGFGVTGVAQGLCKELAARYAREGTPANLTVIHAAGHFRDIGIDLVAGSGAVGRVIGGHWGNAPRVQQLAAGEKFELHNWPQGILISSYRAAAGGREGVRTRIGLDTFIDPRQGGGCLNETARKAGSLIRVECGPLGNEFLHYPRLCPDYAFIRGCKADREGNISRGSEPITLTIDDIALTARSNGGRVFCQVKEVEDRVFSADEIALPGFLVDAVVVAGEPGEDHRHSASFEFEPALLSRMPDVQRPPLHPLDTTRAWIGCRAAMEVMEGDLLNLGIGIPGDAVPPALKKLGMLEKITASMESGVLGGEGVGAGDFGVAFFPSARISEAAIFDLYYGGNLDIAIMGMAEADGEGNINVSQFAGRNVGCGGFIDITQSANRVVFCSPFNGKGFSGVFENGTVRIKTEGMQSKFVNQVQQVTFSAIRSRVLGQKVTLVTERCVFKLGDHGWILTEIAPGLDLEKDILRLMPFLPEISRQLKTMDRMVFSGA